MNRAIAMLMFAVCPVAAHAATAPTLHIVDRDGSRFEYKAKLVSSGGILIEGRFLQPTSNQFSLTVSRTGLVTGMVGDNPVRFSAGAGRIDRLAAELRDDAPAVIAQAN